MRCVGLLLAAAAAAAATATSGQLWSFAITQIADDDHEQATTMVIDPDTGKARLNAPTFAFAANDQSSLDCFIGWSNRSLPSPKPGMGAAGTFIVADGPIPDILLVDVATGNVTSKVPFTKEWFLSAWAWSDDVNSGKGGLIAAVSNTTGTYLASVDITTGVVDVFSTSPFPYPYLEPCEATFHPSRHWMVLLSSDTQRDDADQTWSVVDYTASPPALVHHAPWSYSQHGRTNGFTFLPADSGLDSLLCWAAKDDGSSGPSLLVVDVSGNGNVTVLHTLPKKWVDVTPTLGSTTVRTLMPGSSYRLYALARDMGTEQQLLIVADLTLTSASGSSSTGGGSMAVVHGRVGGPSPLWSLTANVTVLDVDDPTVGGDVYGTVWTGQ